MPRVKTILKKFLPQGLVNPLLPTYHFGRAIIANFKYGFAGRSLKVIGVTGTNGKTTTVHYIASILEAAGHKVAFSTTARFKIGSEVWDNELNMTVTDPFQLQAFLQKVKAAKVDWLVLEVTSHALIQQRIWGVPIHTAVMTNLSQDHLDYHQTMDQYAAAKARLLRRATHNVVLNHDDEWFDFFAQVSPPNRFSYGVHREADLRLIRANLKPTGSKIMIGYGHQGPKLAANLELAGKFNVYNALAAAAVGYALELGLQAIKQGLEKLKVVPGRLEKVEAGQPFNVIVDYAHSPDALRNLFETLKPLTKGRLIVVFGATGDRDKTKRPLMGSLAAKLCEVAIVTDDDPYTEDPATIREQILAGAKPANAKSEIMEVADRHDAIARAFQMAKAGDTVAILGLGHQKYRVVGNRKEPWDDRQIAKKLLEKTKESVKMN